MGGMSIWHWIVVGVIVLLLFGRGKVSELMGDVAKGIKSFKKGLQDDDAAAAPANPAPGEPARSIGHQSTAAHSPEPSAAERKPG